MGNSDSDKSNFGKNRYKYEDLLCLIFNYKIKILKIGGGKGEVSRIYMICCICIFMKFYDVYISINCKIVLMVYILM